MFCTNCNAKIGSTFRSYGEEFIAFTNLREVRQVFEGFTVDPDEPTRFSLTASMYPVWDDDYYAIDPVDVMDDGYSVNDGTPLCPPSSPCDSVATLSADEDDSSSDGSTVEYANSLEDVSSNELSDSGTEETAENHGCEEEGDGYHGRDVLAYLNEQSTQADSAIGRALELLRRDELSGYESEGLPENVLGYLDERINAEPDFDFNYQDGYDL